MKNQKTQFVAVLRQVAELVERSPTNDLDALIQGSAKLKIVSPNRKSRTKSIPNKLFSDHVYEEVARKLEGFQTREEGRIFLDDKIHTKNQTEKLARFLDLPVSRADTVDVLKSKIIESMIGSKLRSQAIQGHRL